MTIIKNVLHSPVLETDDDTQTEGVQEGRDIVPEVGAPIEQAIIQTIPHLYDHSVHMTSAE